MNYRHLALLLLASTLFVSPTFAAPVTMLQFGSFESRAEAEAKLADVKTKHSGVIGSYATSIREVKLPPDNLVVYRTQAGPVANRAAAQSVCAQLASNGDECYVVETAIAQPTAAPSVQTAAADVAGAASTKITPTIPELPAATPVAPTVAKVTSGVAENATAAVTKKVAELSPLPASPTLSASSLPATSLAGSASVLNVPSASSAAALAPNLNAKIPTLAPASTQTIPLVGSRALPSAAAAVVAPEVTAAVPSLSAAKTAATSVLPAASSLAAASQGLARPSLPSAPEVAQAAATAAEIKTPAAPLLDPANDPALAPPSPELQSAIARAVAAQKNAPAAEFVAPTRPATVNAAVEKPAPSLLARLNPFSPSDAKPVAPTVVLPAVSAAPSVPPTNPAPEAIKTTAEAAPLKVTPPSVKPPLDLAPPAAAEIRTPLREEPKAAILLEAPRVNAIAPAPVRLPPPPPPLLASDRSRLPAPITTGVLPAPGLNPSVAPPVPVRAVEVPSQAPGLVKVEEAKRVPLTETVVSAPPVVAAVPGPAATAPLLPPPSLAQSPTATLGQKTIWAQIGQFPDTQAALAYWDRYRQANPDFPVVRVRVTSPYQLKQRGDDRVWLRVGPFERDGFITNLCASVPAETLRCGRVSDLGVAASTTRTPGFLPGSRYQR